MGDPKAMTIEFLRARLLSERSVSRTARQRAEQLAKRVVELEEQLKIVTIQRKKAEKAAVEVLSILETQGIGDFSEAIDSSSDHDEVPPALKGSDCTCKEDETSTTSRVERSELEDGFSGSEPEVSPAQGNSLSWKSHTNSPDSHDKQKAKQIRQRQRRRSFMFTLHSSPKHHSGESCRKIKRREMGSAAVDVNGNGGVTCSNYSDGQPNSSMEASRSKIEEAFADTSVADSLDDQDKASEGSPYASGSGRDDEMERVLKQQAKLIGQFQAEEKAQREWEEKYNENNMSTVAYYEPGNQPCIAENSSQPKEDPTELALKIPHDAEEVKLRAENITSTEPTSGSLSILERSTRSQEAIATSYSNGFMPEDLTKAACGSNSNAWRNSLPGRQYAATAVDEIEITPQEFAFPTPKSSGMIPTKQRELLHKNSNTGSESNSSLHPRGHIALESPSPESKFPINSDSKFSDLGPLEFQNQLQRQLPLAPCSSLGGVLDALQRAKLSLKQELSRLPSPSNGTLAVTARTSSQARSVTPGESLDIPIGSAGLFRLPTDLCPQAPLSGPKFYGSGLSLTAGQSDVGYATSSYAQYPTSPFSEAGSRVPMGKEYYDHRYMSSSMGVAATTRYSLPYRDLSTEGSPLRGEFSTTRSSLPYADLSTQRSPLRGEFSKSYSDVRNGMPPGEGYSLYGGGRTHPDMSML